MVSFYSIIALGFFLGMRHTTDPDHVIAVSTIVSRQRTIARSALIGLFWGVGHTLTIVLVGAAIILFNLVIPPRIGLSMELSVALMLIILGLMNVVSFFHAMSVPALQSPEASTITHSHAHAHGDYVHSHSHGHSPEKHPHRPEQTPLGYLDRTFGRLGLYQYVRPLIVGIVHGLAGSAAVALLVLTTIRNSHWAIAYLLIFGLGTIAGMMLIHREPSFHLPSHGAKPTLLAGAGHGFRSAQPRVRVLRGLPDLLRERLIHRPSQLDTAMTSTLFTDYRRNAEEETPP